MRVGMIARADDRGLGYQTKGFYDHIRPEVTVVIDMTPVTKGNWPQHFDWYPDGVVTPWAGYTAPITKAAHEALLTCDVVYSAETFYDPHLLARLTAAGVGSVRHVNPELFGHEPSSTVWYPTQWRIDDLPPGPVVPVPIDDAHIADSPAGPGLLLHTGGHRATADRNGTQIVWSVIRRQPWRWRITSQDGLGPVARGLEGKVEMVGGVEDRWSLYDGCAVLVMPRRYGGLCLPVLEASARGLAVVMPDCPPNMSAFEVVPVKHGAGGWLGVPPTAGGRIQLAMVAAHDLEDTIRVLMERPELLDQQQQRTLAWAKGQAWSTWLPEYRRLLEVACL